MLTFAGRVFPNEHACHQIIAFWNSSPDSPDPAEVGSWTAARSLPSSRVLARMTGVTRHLPQMSVRLDMHMAKNRKGHIRKHINQIIWDLSYVQL